MEVFMSENIPWLSSLLSALRAGIACLLVSQGLSQAGQYVVFPVFTYVVAVLILSDSTLGKAIQDGVLALYGTLQAVVLSMVVLQIIGTKNMSLGVCLACMFSSSFILTYFPNQKAVTKRLGLAVATIIYVNAYIKPVTTHPVFFPLKLTVTIMLGTISAIVALIVPVPRLSAYQARYQAKLCLHLAVDQFAVLVEAFSRPNQREMSTVLLKYKSLERAALHANRALHQRQLEATWEPAFLTPPAPSFSKRMSSINSWLTGMRMALEDGPATDVQGMLRGCLDKLCEWSRSCVGTDCSTSNGPEKHGTGGNKALHSLDNAAAACSGELKEGSRFRSLFFMFAARNFAEEVQLQTESESATSVNDTGYECTDSRPSCNSCLKNADSPVNSPKNIFDVMKKMNVFNLATDRENYINSLKIGITMTVAVYLGILYKKSLGYWSTITVALGLFNHKSGTFNNTSLRLQGTALGTLYGYLVAEITNRAVVPTTLAMIPWLLFTTFTRQSKLLKPTGASSALTSALIILGKKMPGSVDDFVVIRMTEALIGLSTYLFIEAVVYPRRASKRLREEFRLNVTRIHDCFQAVFDLHEGQCSGCFKKKLSQLKQGLKVIKDGVTVQRELTSEAEVEPELWYGAFQSETHHKLVNSQSRIMELLHYLLSASVYIQTGESAHGKQASVATLVFQEIKVFHTDLMVVFDFLQHSLQDKKVKSTDVESPLPPSTNLSTSTRAARCQFKELLCQTSYGLEMSIGTVAFCCQALLNELILLEKLVQELAEEETS